MSSAPALSGAVEVVRTLREAGFRALLAGGCVRDMQLGRVPADYDVATDAEPDKVAKLFAQSVMIGARFGVVRVRLGDAEYEVARFRKESGTLDGRHPERVTFTSEQEDARRRDFTINGLFYDPVDDRVIDYVDGLVDIRKGLVRAIGSPDERFREDRLRMMRAVRFSSRFHWPIEAETELAIERAASAIGDVSHERLGVELSRILVEGGAPLGIRWLIDLGLMRGLIPELVAMEGVAQPSEFHPEGDVLTHVLLMLGMMRNPSPELAFGVLLHDVGKPLTFERADRIRFNNHDRVGAEIASTACRRLRCSNDQVDHVTQLVAQHHQFMNVRQMRSSTLKRFLRLDRFEDHLELHRLDCLASHRKLGNYDFCVSALEAMGPEEIRPAPLVKGDDLIEMGYSPGPLFRRVLEEVENAQLDGQLDDRDAALALARRTFGTFLEEDGVRSSGEGINSPADS